jgi:hypothetical protein
MHRRMTESDGTASCLSSKDKAIHRPLNSGSTMLSVVAEKLGELATRTKTPNPTNL